MRLQRGGPEEALQKADGGRTIEGKMNVKIVDDECRTDYYLVCLAENQRKFRALFEMVKEDTVV